MRVVCVRESESEGNREIERRREKEREREIARERGREKDGERKMERGRESEGGGATLVPEAVIAGLDAHVEVQNRHPQVQPAPRRARI